MGSNDFARVDLKRGKDRINVYKVQLIIRLVQQFGPLVRRLYGDRLIIFDGRHLRAARALLGWTQEELSLKSKVALGTVKRIEGFDGPVDARMETLRKITAVLERAGVEFLNDDQPGVRLKKK